jgi:hypothetical protein
MSQTQLTNLIVLVIGAGLLVASLLADYIGIGDDVGFGLQQTIGTVTGLVIAAVGTYLYFKAKPGT